MNSVFSAFASVPEWVWATVAFMMGRFFSPAIEKWARENVRRVKGNVDKADDWQAVIYEGIANAAHLGDEATIRDLLGKMQKKKAGDVVVKLPGKIGPLVVLVVLSSSCFPVLDEDEALPRSVVAPVASVSDNVPSVHVPFAQGGSLYGVIGGRGEFDAAGDGQIYLSNLSNMTSLKLAQEKDGVGYGMLWWRSQSRNILDIEPGTYSFTIPNEREDYDETITLCSGPGGGEIDFDEFADGSMVVEPIDGGFRYAFSAVSSLGEEIAASFEVR
jgi:hypothetical protein